jgi:hypothetical protein
MRKLLALIACGLVASCASNGIAPRQTAWHQLPTGAGQPPGFGLYSYVLFAHEPSSEADRAKYVAILRELLAAAPEADRLMSTGLPHERINLTVVPVQWYQDIDNLTLDIRACRLLANYDYARAASIRAMYDRPLDYGPYIVSARTPITTTKAGVGQHLMQDLTYTKATNVGQWVHAFIARTRDRDYFAPDAYGQLALDLRNAVSVMADLGPVVINGVGKFVDWLTPKH